MAPPLLYVTATEGAASDLKTAARAPSPSPSALLMSFWFQLSWWRITAVSHYWRVRRRARRRIVTPLPRKGSDSRLNMSVITLWRWRVSGGFAGLAVPGQENRTEEGDVLAGLWWWNVAVSQEGGWRRDAGSSHLKEVWCQSSSSNEMFSLCKKKKYHMQSTRGSYTGFINAGRKETTCHQCWVQEGFFAPEFKCINKGGMLMLPYVLFNELAVELNTINCTYLEGND